MNSTINPEQVRGSIQFTNGITNLQQVRGSIQFINGITNPKQVQVSACYYSKNGQRIYGYS